MVLRSCSVLLVEDDPTVRKALCTSLSTGEFLVQEAGTVEESLRLAQRQSFDLALLDMNLAGIGGVEACRRLRELMPGTGIVVIVEVRDLKDDKIEALEAGADDYVTRPFPLCELIARLRAVLRNRAREAQEAPVLQAGSLTMDMRRRILRRSGTEVRLSPKQFDLLAFMMKNQRVLTHEQLLSSVWGPKYGNEVEYLRTYVHTLRKKIESDPTQPHYILTAPWVGYRFRNPTD